jgi:phage terminase large subunit-like protein
VSKSGVRSGGRQFSRGALYELLSNPIYPREGSAEIEEHKERLGTYGYAGQYQQRPVPEAVPSSKARSSGYGPKTRIATSNRPQDVRIVQSWDCAIKDSETNSYSVCTTWHELDDRFLLVHVWRKRVEFPELLHALHELAEQFHPDAILIENKASGQSAIPTQQQVRRTRQMPGLAPHIPSMDRIEERGRLPPLRTDHP